MESCFMKKMVGQDHVQCPIDFIVIKSVSVLVFSAT